MTMLSRLQVDNLSVEIAVAGGTIRPVDGVSFDIGANECVALLGESGCGKSLTALALMRLLPEGGRVAGGKVQLSDVDLFALTEREMLSVRGGRLAMIFQEPQTSLNPVMTVAEQIRESLVAHRTLGYTVTNTSANSTTNAEILDLLDSVGLVREKLNAYPFQLSGGQRQRALIAMMLAGEPDVLIADEPTTALDVTVQAQILRLLKRLQAQRGMGLLLITHDLDVAHQMANRVAVMYAGQIVEWAPSDALYAAPRHPYTQKLFAVLPRLDRRGERLDSLPGRVPAADTVFTGCRFAERCPQVFARCHTETPAFHQAAPGHWSRCHLSEPQAESLAKPTLQAMTATDAVTAVDKVASKPVPTRLDTVNCVLDVRDLCVHFPIHKGLFKHTVGQVKAVDGVSLHIAAGETLALVGESGCGKTTLARAILRLIEPTAGQVRLLGEPLSGLSGEALRRKRSQMQIVFQDPFSSLNPRMKVGAILAEGMAALSLLPASAQSAKIADLLNRVGLPEDAASRYPHEFSGGQRQRIAIARALAVEPKLLILDEPTSALDVSVQAQILNLLADLQRQQGLAYLFITHNLAVVSYLAHRIVVMQRGKVVETGPTEALLKQPQTAYTRLLLDSAPGKLI